MSLPFYLFIQQRLLSKVTYSVGYIVHTYRHPRLSARVLPGHLTLDLAVVSLLYKRMTSDLWSALSPQHHLLHPWGMAGSVLGRLLGPAGPRLPAGARRLPAEELSRLGPGAPRTEPPGTLQAQATVRAGYGW